MLVEYERLAGWVDRFGDRHGGSTAERSGARVTLTGADGAVAEYDDVAPPARFGLVLVRRGGYAIGLVDGPELAASKCGTRYVQGKTKAGGWSQQRYARRRANQAAELADAAGTAIRDVLGGAGVRDTFGGGDRKLVETALAASRVRLELRERWLDVPDPRHAVLVKAVGQARSIPIALNALA